MTNAIDDDISVLHESGTMPSEACNQSLLNKTANDQLRMYALIDDAPEKDIAARRADWLEDFELQVQIAVSSPGWCKNQSHCLYAIPWHCYVLSYGVS